MTYIKYVKTWSYIDSLGKTLLIVLIVTWKNPIDRIDLEKKRYYFTLININRVSERHFLRNVFTYLIKSLRDTFFEFLILFLIDFWRNIWEVTFGFHISVWIGFRTDWLDWLELDFNPKCIFLKVLTDKKNPKPYNFLGPETDREKPDFRMVHWTQVRHIYWLIGWIELNVFWIFYIDFFYRFFGKQLSFF